MLTMNIYQVIALFFIKVGIIIFLAGFNTSPYNAHILKYDESPSKIEMNIQWATPEDPYLTKLRLKYHLDDLVKESNNEYDKIQIVTHWVKNLWEHDGSNHPTTSDPLSILELVEKGNRYACVEYSIVLAGSLNSLGIPTRVLALKMPDVETRKIGAGHVVVEAYVENLEKWIMIDGQMDAIPTLDGTPLNAIEFQKHLASKTPNLSIDSLDDTGIAMAPNIQEYFKWITPYLYYLDISIDNRVSPDSLEKRLEGSLMLVPVGAKNPTIFQQKTSMRNFLYTHSVNTFYKRPEKP